MEYLFCYGGPRIAKHPKAALRQLVHYFYIIVHHSVSSSEYFPTNDEILILREEYEDEIRQHPIPDIFHQESIGG
jgi:hypothetical protein